MWGTAFLIEWLSPGHVGVFILGEIKTFGHNTFWHIWMQKFFGYKTLLRDEHNKVEYQGLSVLKIQLDHLPLNFVQKYQQYDTEKSTVVGHREGSGIA